MVNRLVGRPSADGDPPVLVLLDLHQLPRTAQPWLARFTLAFAVEAPLPRTSVAVARLGRVRWWLRMQLAQPLNVQFRRSGTDALLAKGAVTAVLTVLTPPAKGLADCAVDCKLRGFTTAVDGMLRSHAVDGC